MRFPRFPRIQTISGNAIFSSQAHEAVIRMMRRGTAILRPCRFAGFWGGEKPQNTPKKQCSFSPMSTPNCDELWICARSASSLYHDCFQSPATRFSAISKKGGSALFLGIETFGCLYSSHHLRPDDILKPYRHPASLPEQFSSLSAPPAQHALLTQPNSLQHVECRPYTTVE